MFWMFAATDDDEVDTVLEGVEGDTVLRCISGDLYVFLLLWNCTAM